MHPTDINRHIAALGQNFISSLAGQNESDNLVPADFFADRGQFYMQHIKCKVQHAEIIECAPLVELILEKGSGGCILSLWLADEM